MVGNCIIDDEACKEASKEEILRRYYEALVSVRKEEAGEDILNKLQLIMKKTGISADDRKVAVVARAKERETGEPAVSIELSDGRIVTGKTSKLLGASSAALLNALKANGNIDDVKLLSKDIIKPIQILKTDYLKGNNPRLHTDEILIALAVESEKDDICLKALKELDFWLN